MSYITTSETDIYGFWLLCFNSPNGDMIVYVHICEIEVDKCTYGGVDGAALVNKMEVRMRFSNKSNSKKFPSNRTFFVRLGKFY